jgi:hypothetical protein
MPRPGGMRAAVTEPDGHRCLADDAGRGGGGAQPGGAGIARAALTHLCHRTRGRCQGVTEHVLPDPDHDEPTTMPPEPVRVDGAAEDGSHDVTTQWRVPDDRVSGGCLCFVDDASHP